jgi:4-amino-4-deoxy-L-arabinose transferase-like glycosyltransferase
MSMASKEKSLKGGAIAHREENSCSDDNPIAGPPPRIFSSLKLNLLFVFMFAFAVRFLFLQMLKSDLFFENPIFDAEFYDRWAASIADGEWLGGQVYFASPLYAYFLAVLYTLFHHSLYWVIFLQFLLGAVHCVLIYLIGRKLFSTMVGLISAFFASLYGFFLYMEGQLLKSSLAYFLSTFSFYLFLLARERQKFNLWIALGISVGVTALVIPTILAFVPILFVFFIVDKTNRQGAFMRIAALSLGLFIVTAPVTLRNYYVGGDLVLISSNGGINLFLGTDPHTDGGLRTSTVIEQAPELEEQSSKAVAERSLQKHLKPSEVSGFWASTAVKNIAYDLPASFRLLLKKIYTFWNWRENTDNLDFYYFREKYPVLGIPFLQFGAMVPLAFLGMWFSRKQSRRLLPAFVFIIVFAVSSIPFPIFGRYRAPVVPFLIIFAGYGIYELFREVAKKRWKKLATGLFLFIIAFAVVNSGDRGHNFSFMHRSMGEIFIKKGDLRAASVELEKAVEADPGNFYAHNALGYAYLQMGRDDGAIAELRTAIRLYPEFIEAHNTLGLAYAVTGKREAAEEEFKKVRELEAQRPADKSNPFTVRRP